MDWLTAWRIPGCSCAVYHKGERVFAHSSGYADFENKIPMSMENHRMFMYSISKIITCVTALTLWEEGKFLLTDPLWKYLPEWKDMKVKDGDSIVSAEREITVGDLFSMTSGLDYNCDAPSIKAAREKTAPHCPTREIIRALAADPLALQPGLRWCYGLSHDVIGALVEEISSKDLGTLAKERIFDPLGLEKTSYGLDEKYRNEMAVQYFFHDEKDRFERASQDNWAIFGDEYKSGGAGVVSTVSEIAKIMNTLACGGKAPDGPRIIASRTLELMRTPVLSPAQEEGIDWGALKGYSYGLGVRTHKYPEKSGSPAPLREYGWSGAAGGFAVIDPDNSLSLFYAHHMLNNQEDYVTPRLRNILYSCMDED